MGMIKKGTMGGKKAAGPKVRAGGEIPRGVKTGGRVQAAHHDPEAGDHDRKRGIRKDGKRLGQGWGARAQEGKL